MRTLKMAVLMTAFIWPVAAEAAEGKFTAGPQGLDAEYRLTTRLSVRALGNTRNERRGSKAAGVVMDYYPMERGLHLSAGLRVDGDRGKDRPVTQGDATVAPLHDGKPDLGAVAPYIGVGYAAKLSNRAELAADLGVMLQGKPKAAALTLDGDPREQRHRPAVLLTVSYRF